MGEKRLRCKDCEWFSGMRICYSDSKFTRRTKMVNPGQFACKEFVLKDK